MALKVKKLAENAKLPTRAHDGDAGLDLYATSKQIEKGLIVYGTGLAIEIPYGCVGLLFQRSSVCKTDLMLSNCVGVLDSTFRGEVTFKFRPTRDVPLQDLNTYEIGDRIGQLVIVKFDGSEPEFADELSQTTRGTGGYGSTGR